MARPTKQGIDYFPLDCQFDEKTELYIMSKGAAGLAVLITTLQLIYSNEGYFIYHNYESDLPLLIKRRISIDVGEIMSCLDEAINRNIFDKRLYLDHHILTSRGIQKRFFDAAKRKKSVEHKQEFLLISVNANKNEVNGSNNQVKDSNNSTKEKGKEKGKEEVKVKVKGNKIYASMTRDNFINILSTHYEHLVKTRKTPFLHPDFYLQKDKMPDVISGIREWINKVERLPADPNKFLEDWLAREYRKNSEAIGDVYADCVKY